MTTLCGKCGKKEPGCDCRPLAIPESGNAWGVTGQQVREQIEEIMGYRYKADDEDDLSA
jgi:Na+-translocating ferredoxin:NAD+ oxidoreductase RNF subunit RnfB